MACTLGRVGVSAANGGDGIVLPDPFEVVQSGAEVRLAGYFVASSAAQAAWVRDQLLGLDPAANDYETAVPVTFDSAAATLDGYYQPVAVQATLGRGSMGPGGTLRVDWDAALRRPLNFRLPRVELTMTTAQVTNDFTYVASNAFCGVPNEASAFGVGTALSETRVTESGTCRLVSTGLGATYVIPYTVAPASYYKASCRIEYSVGGSYYSTVGRRDFDTMANVRLNNGLVRASVSGSTVTVAWYDGATWESTSTYDLLWSASGSVVTWTHAAVLKNSPEECVVRFWGLSGNSSGFGVTVDLAVVRGSRVLRLYCSGWSSAIYGWRVGHTSAVASTSTTYGLRRTSALDGNYTTMASNNAESKDTTNGRLTNSSTLGPTTAFGLGCSIGTTAADVPDGADRVGGEFYGAVGLSQRVVVS